VKAGSHHSQIGSGY